MILLRRITFLLVLSACAWGALFLFVPNSHQDSVFFCSAKDLYFMDFFMPRSMLSMEHPYAAQGNSPFIGCVPRAGQCYPALAVLLSGCFEESVSGAVLCQALGILVYLLGVWMVLRKYKVDAPVAVASLLVSSPCLFSFEVGNLIFYAAGAVMFFIAWYDSDSRKRRVVAALALAIAAVLKIAPVILGLAYLRRGRARDWRGAFLSGSFFLILLLVPFAFWSGAEGFSSWVENARANSSQAEYVTRNVFGFYGLVSGLVQIVGYSAEVMPVLQTPVRLFSSVFGLLLVILAAFRDGDEFVQMCLLALGMLFVPSTMMCYTVLYVLPFFLVGTARCHGRMANAFGLCFVSSCLPLQIPLLLGSANICFSAAAMLDLSFMLLKQKTAQEVSG